MCKKFELSDEGRMLKCFKVVLFNHVLPSEPAGGNEPLALFSFPVSVEPFSPTVTQMHPPLPLCQELTLF